MTKQGIGAEGRKSGNQHVRRSEFLLGAQLRWFDVSAPLREQEITGSRNLGLSSDDSFC
jgi:hypothetical protein